MAPCAPRSWRRRHCVWRRRRPAIRLPPRTRSSTFGEVVGGARAIGAVHDGDLKGGKRDLLVQRLDRGVVPLSDLAKEDLGKRRPVENDVARLDALDIDHRDDAAHDHGKLDETVRIELTLIERLVGRAERHRLGDDLLDATGRADRLIGKPSASLADRPQTIWRISGRGRWRRLPKSRRHRRRGSARRQTPLLLLPQAI